MTLDRTPSDHSHTGNQVGCEHRIGKQDGQDSHSLHQHPNEADKANEGKACGDEGFHLDCPPIGLRTVFRPDASEQPAGAQILNSFRKLGSKGTDGPRFAVSDDLLFHTRENARA